MNYERNIGYILFLEVYLRELNSTLTPAFFVAFASERVPRPSEFKSPICPSSPSDLVIRPLLFLSLALGTFEEEERGGERGGVVVDGSQSKNYC